MCPRKPRSLTAFLLLLLILGLGACSSGDDTEQSGGPGPVVPGADDLSIRFLVYQIGGNERLLWKGSSEGPDADSPQRTAVPRIPGAEPFRIDWELMDGSVSILGFQYRTTQDPAEGDLRLPRDANDDPVWGAVQSFSYENSTPSEFITSRCPTGGDCPEILLWDSTSLHSIWVFAGTADGQESPLDEARLDFEIVNEVPTTELVEDGTYPYWSVDGVAQGIIAEGDTIPAGAKVVFKLNGSDPDPVVLKMELPRVRFQGIYRFEERSGPMRDASTFYSTPSEADTVEFEVGPFSYSFSARAVDRLRAVDPTPISFQFHAGFAPSLDSISPSSSDEILLRNPPDGTWPQNTVDYGSPEVGVDRWWTGSRFIEVEFEGLERWTGSVFRIPMLLTGSADSREPATAGFGDARSFAYEWFGNNDPENNVSDGGGSDLLTRFADASSPNAYLLDADDAIEIFVPTEFWLQPSLFDTESCDSSGGRDYCGVGELLRKQLGQISLRARTRHTARNQDFEYWSGTVHNDGANLVIDVGDWGLMSDILSSSFPMHLGVDDGSGGVIYWPAQN